MNENIVPDNPISELQKKEIDLHIAEYNALTNRATYLINIQVLILTAIVAWILVMGTLWNSYNCWFLFIGTQLILIINVIYIYEHYLIVKYLEKELKPKIASIIRNDHFWRYEQFLKNHRKEKNKNKELKWIEYGAVILSGIGVIFISIYRLYTWDIREGVFLMSIHRSYSWNIRDVIGLLLNVFLFISLLRQTNQCVKVRFREWQ